MRKSALCFCITYSFQVSLLLLRFWQPSSNDGFLEEQLSCLAEEDIIFKQNVINKSLKRGIYLDRPPGFEVN